MKSVVSFLLFFGLVILSAGCKKDRHDVTPAPLSLISIKLNPQYLGIGQVDSAFAIWKINNVEQRVKMMTRHDSLIADINRFTEGTGELVIHIFSNKKYSNQYFGQWVAKKTMSLQKYKAINYNGPSSFYDVAWFPRVELADGIGHKATLALRPDDAFFIVKDPGHDIFKLIVDRSYWKNVGGVQLVGVAVWECYNGCIDIVNDEFFKLLPERIGNKSWNHISITVLFQTTAYGEGWIISLEHEP